MIISAVQSFDVVQAAGSVGHGDCNSCGAGQVRPGTRLPEVLVPILYGTIIQKISPRNSLIKIGDHWLTISQTPL